MQPARLILGALVALLLMLQWSIWFGAPDAFDALALREEIEAQATENAGLRERNAALSAEVADLKQGSEAAEERARSDLGMVKKDETFYQIIPAAKPATTAGEGAPAPATAPAATDATAAGRPPERSLRRAQDARRP